MTHAKGCHLFLEKDAYKANVPCFMLLYNVPARKGSTDPPCYKVLTNVLYFRPL